MANHVRTADSYDFIVEHFTQERIEKRFAWLYDMMQDYIEMEELQDDVYVSEDLLKEFQEIEKVNDSKIYAYTIFWLLRHKPIQIKEENAEETVFINEQFASEILKGYLFRQPENVAVSNLKKEAVDNFTATLLYYFKYRDYSAKSIEMIILAFEAGRGYQYSADCRN